MPIYKKVNVDFFKKWSPKMAYVLGFFMADGSIDINPRGSHYLSIQICDKELLESIKKTLESNHKISVRKGFGNESDKYRLQIGRKEMFEDLQKLGVNQQKSHTMEMPKVPKKYFGDFVRGYFDGDGNVWVGFVHKERKTPTLVIHTVFTSCSRMFLNSLHNEIQEQGILGGGIICKKNAFCLKYSINDSLKLYKLMYNSLDNDLFLERKRIVFKEFAKLRV
ncbi:MAG: hypothetical protein KAJ58_00920 [Candidatus Pacebacteria bacterium]|nr:hypothetical protein [Candidatus Paceibacterota bacterium]